MPLYVGAPLLLLLFAASALPWLLVLRARFGHLLAVPATAGGGLLLFFATLCVSHLLDTNYVFTLIVVSVVAGALGVVLALRTTGILRRPGRYAVALWCAPLLGGLVWIITVGIAQFTPSMSRFGWAMNGDALNNLYDASVIMRDNGVSLGDVNAVQLPAALLAAGIGAGSPSSGSARAALEHQLQSFTLVWVLLLAALCLLSGVVVASLISSSSIRTVAVVGALGSLLPLTWFVTGLTVQWGYFNVDVVLPIALGAWLIYLGSDRHPIAALVFLIGFAILAFTAWTPIAIPVVGLGVTLVVRKFPDFRAIRLRYVLPILILAAVGLLVAIRPVDVAAILNTGGGLSTSGSGYTGFVNLWMGVPIAAAIVAVGALVVHNRTTFPTRSGAIGILAGGAVTSAFMIYMASGGPHELFEAYYPKKFAWILIVLLGIIGLSLLVAALAGRVRLSLLAFTVIVAVFAAAILPPGNWPEALQRQPIIRIAGDYVRHDGEATVREILARTTATHSTVLWQSGDPDEPIINEWLLLSHGGLAVGNKKLIALIGSPYFLYRTSGRYTDPGVGFLCRILPLLHGKRVVVTANASIAAQLRSSCPSAPATVVVTQSLVGPEPTRTGENWQTDGIEGPFR